MADPLALAVDIALDSAGATSGSGGRCRNRGRLLCRSGLVRGLLRGSRSSRRLFGPGLLGGDPGRLGRRLLGGYSRRLCGRRLVGSDPRCLGRGLLSCRPGDLLL